MKLQTNEGKLYPEDPFDFKQSLNFIDMFLPSENEYLIEDLSLTKAIHLDGQTVAFKLNSVGTVEKPVLNYKFYGYKLDNKLQTDLVDRINFFLSLDDYLKPFYQYASHDESFNKVVDESYGLHQVKFLTPFEAAGWAVLSQRIPMKVANKMKENLTKSVGNKINLDGQDYWAFPSPDQILNLDLDHRQPHNPRLRRQPNLCRCLDGSVPCFVARPMKRSPRLRKTAKTATTSQLML